MGIRENLLGIKNSIPKSVEIVAVSKTRTAAEVVDAILAGAKIIGENYVQEAYKKYSEINSEIKKNTEWHMIGHLQKNKARKAIKIFDCIQSVESFELAKKINEEAEKLNKRVKIFIEINIGEEKTKSGILPEEAFTFLEKLASLKNLKIKGLMAIEPLGNNSEMTRQYFKKMKGIFEKAKEVHPEIETLSIGMSNSYKIAIEEGSNMIRVGTAIFGPRINSE